ncbi:MAG: DNA-binding protein [Methylococcaceae bacterium]|nr:DNA-binding protein [Methylococcaceae bacterium]
MKSKQDIKKIFADRGETFEAWAVKKGFKVRTVYAVINGQLKGSRGISHKIAIELGLKNAVNNAE